jgi:hypothetical protein
MYSTTLIWDIWKIRPLFWYTTSLVGGCAAAGVQGLQADESCVGGKPRRCEHSCSSFRLSALQISRAYPMILNPRSSVTANKTEAPGRSEGQPRFSNHIEAQKCRL